MLRSLLARMAVLNRFRRDEAGAIGVMFALGVIPMAGFSAAALDYNRVSNLRAQLQASADAAALAGAVRPVPERDPLAFSIFDANASEVRALAGVTIARSGASSSDATQYTVSARARVPSVLAGLIGQPKIDVAVTATAVVAVDQQAAGGGCFTFLHPNTNGGLRVNGNGRVVAPHCVVDVHSADNHGFIINAGSVLDVKEVCVRGGALMNPGHRTGMVKTACNPKPDPLAASVPTLSNPACDPARTNMIFNPSPSPHVLTPGVYCGHVNFNGGAANIVFSPGTYYIKARFAFNSGSVVRGTDVTFVFIEGGTFQMNGQMEMYLDAPTSGTFANWLFVTHGSVHSNNFIFNNERGQRLSGNIYMPTWDIQFNSQSHGSDQDKVTVVARTGIFNAQANWRVAPGASSTSSGFGGGAPKGPARLISCATGPCNGAMPGV